MPLSIRPYRRVSGLALVVCLLSLSSLVGAESLWSGTWVLRENPAGGHLTMTLEEVGSGWQLTYKVVGTAAVESTVSTVLTPLDGKEAPVLINGEPSGQTMAIQRIDSRHTITVVRYHGKERSVAKSEISPDGKVLIVETDYATSNPIKLPGKQIEYWNKQ